MRSSSVAHNPPATAKFTSAANLSWTPADRNRAIRLIFNRLYRRFGPQYWWPARTEFEVCVGAVLTQNATWTSVERAITRLRDRSLLNPAAIEELALPTLARLIRPAGCYRMKAKRLKAFVRWLKEHGGLAALRNRPTGRTRRELLKCYGIGPETADSILLYALKKPVFVVDTYTRRILSRHGIISGTEPYEEIQRLLAEAMPRSTRIFNEYHALLVRLGKTHCRFRPSCAGCPLQPN